MDPNDIDFDENDVFGGGDDEAGAGGQFSDSGSEGDAAERGEELGSGAGEGEEDKPHHLVKFSDDSGKDFTIMATTAPSNAPLHIRPAMRKGSTNPYDYMSQSLSNQLGTSAPIAIPKYGSVMGGVAGMGTAKGPMAGAGPEEEGDTMQFVPPHMMTPQAESLVDDFGDLGQNFSVESHLRRDRLRMRTAVLRSTGFIEPSRAEPVPGGGNGSGQRSARSSQLIAEQGALSAAFSPSQTVSLAT